MSNFLPSNRTSRFIIGSHKLGDARLGLSNSNLIQLIEKASQSGFLHLDTAPIYGLGTADRLISSFIESNTLNKSFVVDSKIGLHKPSDNRKPVFLSYDKNLVESQLSQILTLYKGNLRYIYLHYPPLELCNLHPCLEVLNQYVAQGLIKGIGLSNFSYAQILYALDYADIRSIQLCFSPSVSHYPLPEIFSILHLASKLNLHCSSYGTLAGLSSAHACSSLMPGDDHVSRLSFLFSQSISLGFSQILTSLTKSFHLDCLKKIQLTELDPDPLFSKLNARTISYPPLKF